MSPKKKSNQLSNKEFLLMIVPVILAMLVVAFTVGLYVSQKIANNRIVPVEKPDIVNEVDDEDADEVDDSDGAVDWESLPDLGGASVAEPAEIQVNWFDEPIDVSEELEEFEWTRDDSGFSFTYDKYQLGIVDGPQSYENYIVSLLHREEIGIGTYSHYHYLLEPSTGDGPAVLLVAESNNIPEETFALYRKFFLIDEGSTIPALDFPESVTFPSGNRFVVMNNRPFSGPGPHFYPDIDETIGGAIGTIGGVTLYRDVKDRRTGNYSLIRPDSRVANYIFDFPFWENDTSRDPQELTFNAISDEFTGSYIKQSFGGCGSGGLNITNFVTEDPARVRPLGTIDGYQFYELSESGYADKLDSLTTWLRMNDDKTADDFFNLKPFLYVQDFENNWIELTSVEVVPPAECGKPVIYLYPEEELDVSVELELEGGFTKVEPAYNDGWNVIASPDGSLYNKDDGQMYPYLFWEGHGGSYEAPEHYWVMSQEEVPKTVGKLLAAFGLNGQEIYDFMDFWMPLMNDAPYYKVGFHGTHVMDQLAPLTVTPAPDSVFRILMDYEELDAPIEANPLQHITPFDRKGFSVVEWGGVLSIEDKIQ